MDHEKSLAPEYVRHLTPSIGLVSRSACFHSNESILPPHSADNRLPPNIHSLKAITPVSIFNFLFSIVLLNTIDTNTNVHEEAKVRVNSFTSKACKAITLDKLKISIGSCIYMELFTVPSVKDYWKHEDLHPVHPITK